jgi:adenylate cyclase
MGFVFHSGYRFGTFVLNLDRMCLQEDGKDLGLRPKAFDTLRMLVSQAGRLVTKDELVAAVWPNVTVNDDALAQCIRDIRKALKDEDERYIRTVPRRGYMFVAEVEPLPALGKGKAAGGAPARRRWPVPAAIAAAFALVLVALAAWNMGWRAVPPASDTRLTIAVLPFAAGQDEEWLGDGLAEDIMTAVSRFRDLTVIARNSSFRFRDSGVDPKEVGQALKADYLLQGTVRRMDERLRITAQLVDASSGASRWTERYDRPMSDIFDIKDEVAESVAGQLALHAKEAAFTRVRTRAPQSLQAYELALRGRKAYRTFSREGNFEAKELAERAIAIDPTFAPAWEVLAAALLQFFYQPYDENHRSPAMLEEARKAAEQAVWLDGTFSTAQAMLAATLVPARDYEGALAAIEKAIDLNPNDPVALGTRGNIMTSLGRYEEAIESWEQAERIDPFTPPLAFALKAAPHIMIGEYEKALTAARTCADRAPRLQPCYIYLAIAASELGLQEEAEAALVTLLDINPGISIGWHQVPRAFHAPEESARLDEMMRRAGFPE